MQLELTTHFLVVALNGMLKGPVGHKKFTCPNKSRSNLGRNDISKVQHIPGDNAPGGANLQGKLRSEVMINLSRIDLFGQYISKV